MTIIVPLQPTVKAAQDHLIPVDLLSPMANTLNRILDTHSSFINTRVVILTVTSKQDMSNTSRSTTLNLSMHNIHHIINNLIIPAEDLVFAPKGLDSVARDLFLFGQEEPTCSPRPLCVVQDPVALVP